MKCPKCNNEPGLNSSTARFCPYCGTALSVNTDPESSPVTFDTSAEALVFIYEKHGAEILLGKKLSAYLADYAPELSDKTIRLVKMIYDLGAANALKSGINGSDDDRHEAVRKAVLKLTDNFIAHEIAESIINEFSAALGWDKYNTGVSERSTSPKEAPKDELIITDDSQADFIRQTYRLAQNGNVMAQLEIGKRILDENGVEYDQKEAVKWFTAAASQGNAEAMYLLGKHYYRESLFFIGDEPDEKSIENSMKALELFASAAGLGNTAAKYRLGNCYQYGKGTKEDAESAVIWYRRAAQDGYAEAMYKLGDCYKWGSGVKKDEKAALSWYKKAAEKNYDEAQLELGNYYSGPFNDDFDIHEAIKWYKLVAMNKKSRLNSMAQRYLGDIYSSGDYFPTDNKEAFKWYKMAAVNGNSIDKTSFGDIYLKGELGVKKDFCAAQKWYDEADEKIELNHVISFAQNGDQYAQLELGKRYYYGSGAVLDYNAAFTQFKKSADSGNIDAMYYLGLCYYYGNGVPQNVGNAVSLIKTAAAYGQEEAKEMLE